MSNIEKTYKPQENHHVHAEIIERNTQGCSGFRKPLERRLRRKEPGAVIPQGVLRGLRRGHRHAGDFRAPSQVPRRRTPSSSGLTLRFSHSPSPCDHISQPRSFHAQPPRRFCHPKWVQIKRIPCILQSSWMMFSKNICQKYFLYLSQIHAFH